MANKRARKTCLAQNQDKQEKSYHTDPQSECPKQTDADQKGGPKEEKVISTGPKEVGGKIIRGRNKLLRRRQREGSSPEEKKKELSNGAIRKKDKGSQKGKDERSEGNKITDERAQERERARQERKAKKENLDAFRHWEPSHEWPIKF